MRKRLLVIIAIVFILNCLLASQVSIRIAKGLSDPSLCPTLPGVMSVAFSPDSKYLISVGVGNLAQLWDVQSGKKLLELSYPDGDGVLYHVVYAPNGQYIAASSDRD